MREENQSSKLAKVKANLQKVLKKRWVLPAVYLGLAAVVLTTVLWLQGTEDQLTQEDPNVEQGTPSQSDVGLGEDYQEALPVATVSELIQKPVAHADAKVVGHFFDFDATEEQQQAALVFYDNTYYQNKGIDFALESGETFDVVAALSGTVVKVEKDPIFGNVVHIEHENKVATVYQSLDGVKVEQGQSVKQGDVIGQAGRNLYNKDAGVHVHFEIHQEGIAVNPALLFEQPISAIETANAEVAADEEQADNSAEEGTEEEAESPAEGTTEEEVEAPAEGTTEEEVEAPAEGDELEEPTDEEIEEN